MDQLSFSYFLRLQQWAIKFKPIFAEVWAKISVFYLKDGMWMIPAHTDGKGELCPGKTHFRGSSPRAWPPRAAVGSAMARH